ncbi:formate dehydrogenase accessory protein FdhD [Roseivirga spongicola]|uniref:Sulfur carrier protein FdhD n=1 Tax=Roseivirga spongicola TaxID=333140 RepID=A0A150X476_9BACT|nr:formate dehydrogenase accessory sulfurtransferase FdhD [Roseivirga spongicola]KYG73402.1 formate dehydrogenase accessory protein FdhD [Roseivirga spongicola]
MIQTRKIKRVDSFTEVVEDSIAIEEPLEISMKKESEITTTKVSITMRTPGNDSDLALGFLFTEGILTDFNDVISVSEFVENEILITLKDSAQIEVGQIDRNFYTTSSCGVCGKASIDAIHTVSSFDIDNFDLTVKKEVLYELPASLQQYQTTFNQTGGIHAAALFTNEGALISYQEDVGRHNALDKLIGEAFTKGQLPLRNNILLLSGRGSFELLQKAGMAGIPIVACVGAPSSLAIDLAEEQAITLIGFLKKDRFNLYSRYERVQ